jgi:hypothetical protein
MKENTHQQILLKLSKVEEPVADFPERDWLWRTARGDVMPIKNMDHSHIRNCIKYIRGYFDKDRDYHGHLRDEWIKALKKEDNFRQSRHRYVLTKLQIQKMRKRNNKSVKL